MQIQITNNLKHQAALGVVACKVQVTKSGSELVSLLTNETETITQKFTVENFTEQKAISDSRATLLAAKP